MGSFFTSPKKRAQKRAAQIRNALYEITDACCIRYREKFAAIDPAKKEMIKKSSASELATLMDKQVVSSNEVVLTFIERTLIIGVRNNYVIDEMFEQAIKKSEECDQQRQANPHKRCWRYGDNYKQTFPPFFGVPISLKETILYKNKITYIGVAFPINDIPSQDSDIVIQIKNMGFIPFVRTNVSQANLTFQTNNNLFGYAKNPWNLSRSCGGSSGGECGLVASFCSPFGIASDLLGDSKVPCEFTGCFTFKPFNRYCNLGHASGSKYLLGLPFRQQFTPITRSVEDLITWNQFLCNNEHHQLIPKRQRDSYQKIINFNQSQFESKKSLKIGYLTDFRGFAKCSPSHRRAIQETIKVLEQQGHNTIEIEINQAQALNTFIFRLYFASRKLEIINEVTKGERKIPQFNRFITYAGWSWFLKKLIGNILHPFQPRTAEEILSLKPMNAKDYFISIYEYNRIQKKIYAYLQRNQIDAVIAPGFFMPAYKQGESSNFTYCSTYSTLWSLLQYPTGCVPITVVAEDQQSYSDYHGDNITKRANQNMKQSAGLPIGIQVVSYPGSQQLILSLMKTIDHTTNFNGRYRSVAFEEAIIHE